MNTRVRINDILPLYTTIFFGFLGYALTITLYVPMLMDENYPLFSSDITTQARLTLSGLLLAMYPLGQFLGSPIIGKLSDQYGRKQVLLISLSLCTLGFLGMYLSIRFHWIILLFVSSFFTGLCESNMAIAQSVIAEKVDDPIAKTKLIGYGYSVCSLGYIAGPMLSSVTLNYALPFLFATFAIPFLIIWVVIKFKDQHKPSAQAPINILASLSAFKTIFNNPTLYKIYIFNFSIFFSVQGLYRVVPLYVVDTWNPSLKLCNYSAL